MEALLVEQSDIDQAVSLRPALEQGGFHVTLAHTLTDFAREIGLYWPNCVVCNPGETLAIADFKEALDNTNLAIPFIIIGKKSDLPPYHGNNVAFVDPTRSLDLGRSITKMVSSQKDRFFRLPDLTIDYQRQAVLRHGQTITFTPKLFKLLDLLISHENQVIERRTIMKVVWDTEYMGDTRTLDVHIRWLREKIEENPSKPKYLVTVRGVGYCFVPPPE